MLRINLILLNNIVVKIFLFDPPLKDGHTFMRKFQEHHDNFKLGNLTLPAENPLGQSCYDATWILSLALNRTIASTDIAYANNYYI